MQGPLLYSVGALVLAAGIAGSFQLAKWVDSSLSLVKKQIYVDETNFFAETCFSLFASTSEMNGLVDALSIINVTSPDEFDTLSYRQTAPEAISHVNIITRVSPELTDSAAADIGAKYNTTIDFIYITDRAIEGDLFVVQYVFPRITEILGLVVNSEESRALSIQTALQYNQPEFIDNVVLADTGELGRLGFYPVIPKTSNSAIDNMVNMVIRYNSVFQPLVTQLESTFHGTHTKILVDGNVVFDTNAGEDLSNPMRFTSNTVDIFVSSFIDSEYSNVFIYMFVTGTIVVISMVVLLLLNGSRVKAERYSSLKSRFIADISHEIRTPINGIMGMAGLLGERSLDDTCSYYVKTISSCGATLMMLINDILDMSKIEAGLLDTRQDTITVQEVVKSTVDSVWGASKMKEGLSINKLELLLEFADGLPKQIIGDGFRIQQVLSNLLSNSLKFTDAGSIKTVVSCVEDRRYISVSVQDTGCGMTKKHAKKIFDTFSKVHPKKGGTGIAGVGLGLSISKQLCGLMGGKIVCSSDVGVGTTVIFTVNAKTVPGPYTTTPPLRIVYTHETVDTENPAVENQVDVEADSVVDPVVEQTQPKILVVDDVLINRKLLSKILESIGVYPDTCENGLQAVQMCNSSRYSLVLMDVVMPMMDGVEACVKIKSNPKTDTPVVFVSANVQSDEIARCKKAGGSEFVPKPVSKAKIVEVLAKYINDYAWRPS